MGNIVPSHGAASALPYLTVIILLPIIFGLVVGVLPRDKAIVAKVVGGIGMLATAVLAVAIMFIFATGKSGYQMVTDHTWISQLGISWHFGVDGLSLFLVVLVALLAPIALYGAEEKYRTTSFISWVLILEGACIGSFLALDVFVFFIFFELTLIPTYFMVAGWGGKERGKAALKFFLYTLLGSAFLLAGMLILAGLHQSQTGTLTFDLTALAKTHLTYSTEVLLFLCFSAAFAVKTPIFPFHTWSPLAYKESPIAGAVMLAGVMAKLGTYGLVRFDLTLFPRASYRLAPLFLTLGVIGIIYGAVVAAWQKDFKRLVAFSSLSHLGFVVLGIFAFTVQGLTGGILQMFNHGIVTAAMFLLIGMITKRTGSWQISSLGGIQRVAPVLAGIMMVVVLAGLGLPGLNGFIGEFLILTGTFLIHRWWAVAAAGGVILSAVYLLWAYQRAFHGTPDEGIVSKMKEINFKESMILAPLIALIVLIGVFPAPMLDRITPTVNSIVAHVDSANHVSPPSTGAKSTLSSSNGGGK
ncbi:MAG: NADH-quinone oxidoreductase subunit M [Acidimicrobiales bacterium]|nr:NADH-quinone oxidoreductase subunit M [Acidimicrobiales bacterium]